MIFVWSAVISALYDVGTGKMDFLLDELPRTPLEVRCSPSRRDASGPRASR